MPDVSVREALGAEDMRTVQTLFREYADWLGVDLCFQGFEQELQGLPGFYRRPQGCLLFAEIGDETAGIVGVRPVEDGIAEMKRLWVRAGYRGSGIGRLLAEASVSMARQGGYRAMVLDTLSDPRLDAARGIYETMGFRQIPAYYHNPLEGVLYYRLDL